MLDTMFLYQNIANMIDHSYYLYVSIQRGSCFWCQLRSLVTVWILFCIFILQISEFMFGGQWDLPSKKSLKASISKSLWSIPYCYRSTYFNLTNNERITKLYSDKMILIVTLCLTIHICTFYLAKRRLTNVNS